MRRNKEIIILLVLLAGMMAFVLWYVIDRRAKNRLPTAAKQAVGQTPAGPPLDKLWALSLSKRQAGTGPTAPPGGDAVRHPRQTLNEGHPHALHPHA